MTPVPEREVIRRRARELVLCPLRVALGLVHARKAERVERARVGVHRVVEMHRVRRGGDERAFWDERPVGERDVLEDFTVEGNYGARRLAGTGKGKGSVRDVRVLAVQTLRLAHEAVELPHLPDTGTGPALSRNDGIDLIAKGLDVFCFCCEVVESMSDALPRVVSQSHIQPEAH